MLKNEICHNGFRAVLIGDTVEIIPPEGSIGRQDRALIDVCAMDNNTVSVNRVLAHDLSSLVGADVWPTYQAALFRFGMGQRIDEPI